jgi:hypothetical protein
VWSTEKLTYWNGPEAENLTQRRKGKTKINRKDTKITKTDFLNRKVAKVKGLSAVQEPYDESLEARQAALALLPQIRVEKTSELCYPSYLSVQRVCLCGLCVLPVNFCLPFASLADVAKGGDGAKSALREIFLFSRSSSPGCPMKP